MKAQFLAASDAGKLSKNPTGRPLAYYFVGNDVIRRAKWNLPLPPNWEVEKWDKKMPAINSFDMRSFFFFFSPCAWIYSLQSTLSLHKNTCKYLFLGLAVSFSASREAKVGCIGFNHEPIQRNPFHLKMFESAEWTIRIPKRVCQSHRKLLPGIYLEACDSAPGGWPASTNSLQCFVRPSHTH